jgi:hypothetical protein
LINYLVRAGFRRSSYFRRCCDVEEDSFVELADAEDESFVVLPDRLRVLLEVGRFKEARKVFGGAFQKLQKEVKNKSKITLKKFSHES